MQTYQLFSDESGNREDRFEAIGTISGTESSLRKMSQDVFEILQNNHCKFVEYKKIKSHKYFLSSLGVLDVLFNYINAGKIKITVLVWDKEDTRHKVVGRDDIKNFSIMYYHSIKCTQRYWAEESAQDYDFHPDEISKINFDELISILNHSKVKNRSQYFKTLFGVDFVRNFSKVINHREIKSDQCIPLQVIDIITGLVRLSYEEFDTYKEWLEFESNPKQDSLFEIKKNKKISEPKELKYKVIKKMNELTKKYKMNISLKNSDTKGFKSYRKNSGIYLWKYIPQRKEDIAPTRK